MIKNRFDIILIEHERHHPGILMRCLVAVDQRWSRIVRNKIKFGGGMGPDVDGILEQAGAGCATIAGQFKMVAMQPVA